MKRRGLALVLGLMAWVAVPAAGFAVVLDPVVVTATRSAQPKSQLAASVTVITADQIAATGATRLDEVLRDAVGLQITSSGPAGAIATPSIRGSEGAQVLVLLDGIRLNSPQSGQFNLSNLPVALDEIERIEVLRGPASALYGTSALGGVIQIFTREPESEPQTSLSWSEGRFDSRSISLSTSARKEGVRYRLAAGLDRSRGYRTNSDLEQGNLNGMLGFELGGGYDLRLSAFHLDKENGVPGSTSWPSPRARQQDKNTLADLSLSGPAGPIELTVRGSYERRRNDYQDPGAWTPVDDTHIVETYGSELTAGWNGGPGSLLVGGDVYRDRLDSTASGRQQEDRWSLFGQYELQAATWVKLLLGLRYDAHSDFRNEWSPRAAALFSLTESARLRASVSRAFRAPTLNDRYWPTTSFARGNPDLDPETAWEYELALDQGLGERGNLSLAVFRRDARDLIDWRMDSSFVWSPVNVNEARIWGAEAELDLQLHEQLKAGANYTYLYPKDRATDRFLDNRTRHQAHLYLEAGPVREARLRLDGRYLKYYGASRATGGFVVLDASLSRPFVLDNGVTFDARITVKNLLDRRYEENPGYPMPPRQLFAGVTAYF
ncbi:outer membrane receptor for ferrienterochelin and colicins/vitamin B12 transporter [Geothermobacter ehrlichii]|uniref:Outer membrane receptor for ferrienterochelin and colicins/vitamin B12 transporter n=1 Tax=Geothermobacter ehrlichii TaxID=213224 RepID=A0A5D3WIR6_9BACT|nr:TonB-dependent receptor [Geothermobacter ehrlichii]TYO97700.1 outer membrane receptor for ferrienterochelin and colicins/vitamin B12 transporter [Geothermobacter ehrlichii]